MGRPAGVDGFKPYALESAISTYLYRHGAGSSKIIAQRVGANPGSVRAALKRMEARGEVSKGRRRRNIIWST